jgi:hypothetical protein
MARLNISFAGSRLARRFIALLAIFALGALLYQPTETRGQPPARGGRRPPVDNPRAPEVPEIEPEDAEPEEGPPEKKYKSLPVDEKQNRKKSEIGRILRTGKFAGPEEQQSFDDFFLKYLLARWTVQSDITSLPARRQELLNYLRTHAPAAEVHDRLNRLVLDFMKSLIGGDHHPAAKINAMLVIGDLNAVEPAAGVTVVPWSEALNVLIAAVESQKIPDGLRAAAMIGILRHASAGIQNADAQKPLTVAMLRLANGDVPTGTAPSGRAWIVAQALETLGILGSTGEDNAVFKAMLKIVADPKLPLLLRSAAADSLGRLNYSSAGGISPAETAVALGQLALDACAEELRLAKETSRLDLRRRMLHRLDAVLMALVGEDETKPKGIVSLAKDPAQTTFVTDLKKTVKNAIDVLDDKKKENESMKPAVVELQKNLKDWLQKKP